MLGTPAALQHLHRLDQFTLTSHHDISTCKSLLSISAAAHRCTQPHSQFILTPFRILQLYIQAAHYTSSGWIAVSNDTATTTGFTVFSFAHVESPVAVNIQVVTPPADIETPPAPPKRMLSSGIKAKAQNVVNLYGAHTATTTQYYQPEYLQQLRYITQRTHQTHQKPRPVGSALSPDGLPFASGGIVNLVIE